MTLRLGQFTDEGESGALFLKRMERKCGSAWNVEKPHADPKLCPILHRGANVRLSRNQDEGSGMKLDPTYELFAESFTPRCVNVAFSSRSRRGPPRATARPLRRW